MRSGAFDFLFLLASLGASSCGREEETASTAQPREQAAPSHSAAPTTAQVPEPPAVLPGAMVAPREAALADKWKRRSSVYDGWESEVFNEAAGPVLSALGKLLAHPDQIDEQELADLCAESLACSPLRPTPLETAFESPRLRVLRAADPPAEPTDRAGLAARLRELAAPYGGDPRAEAKFKVVTVDLDSDPPATEALLLAWGHGPSGPVQHNAAWHVGWERREGAKPRIASIAVRDFEEVLGPAGPLFEECTGSVLGAERAFAAQLLPSLEHWAAALDVELGMSVIGHQGLAVGDADGDLLDDLYLCQPGGLPNLLFLQRPDGTAREVAAEAGVDFLDSSRSALLLDLDSDGDQDLVVELDPHVLLLENLPAGPGQPRFRERARLDSPGTTSLAAADVDLEGDLDLYACCYLLPDARERTPLPYHDANNGPPNALFLNQGGWRFENATRQLGLDQNNRRFSFACAFEDYDRDGDPDLVVANDFGRKNLYRNDGAGRGGRFVDVAAAAGVEDMAAGMGVTWSDFDLDGRVDLYLSNMFSSAGGRVTYQRRFLDGEEGAVRAGFRRHARGNSLFLQAQDGAFVDASEEARVTMGRWAWGAIAFDFDDDSHEDLFVPNGYVTGEDPEDL